MGKGSWDTPNVFVFSPDSLLSGNTRYQVKILGRGVSDLLGNLSAIDSAFISGFVTLDPNEVGTVSGSVRLAEKPEHKLIIWSLWPLGEKGLPLHITLALPGSFRFERVLPGKYLLGGYMDIDGNQILSPGQPVPFSPLEPFALYPDTIRVRPRWETEEVELIFH
jgi:hypothetical protein